MKDKSISHYNSLMIDQPYRPLSKEEGIYELGQFVEIMSRSKRRQMINLASFIHWVKPAVLHRQYKFLRLTGDIDYTGYLLWAWVDDATLLSFMTEHKFLLKPMHWNEGGNFILVDWYMNRVCFRQMRTIYKQLTSAANLSFKDINICIRDEQGNIIRTNKRALYGC